MSDVLIGFIRPWGAGNTSRRPWIRRKGWTIDLSIQEKIKENASLQVDRYVTYPDESTIARQREGLGGGTPYTHWTQLCAV